MSAPKLLSTAKGNSAQGRLVLFYSIYLNCSTLIGQTVLWRLPRIALFPFDFMTELFSTQLLSHFYKPLFQMMDAFFSLPLSLPSPISPFLFLSIYNFSVEEEEEALNTHFGRHLRLSDLRGTGHLFIRRQVMYYIVLWSR